MVPDHIPRPENSSRSHDGNGDTSASLDRRSLIAWFGAASLVPLLLAAGFSMALVEGAIGAYLSPGAQVPGLRPLLYAACHSVLAGGLLAGAAWVTFLAVRTCERLLNRRIQGFFWGSILAAGWVTTSLRLFEGGFISNIPYISTLRIGFYCLGTLVLLWLVERSRRHLETERPAPRLGSQLLITGTFLLLGAAAQFGDATLYTGGYPGLHAQLAVLALLSHLVAWVFIASLLEDRVPDNPKSAVLLLAVGIGFPLAGCVILRKAQDINQLQDTIRNPAFSISYKLAEPLEQILLGRIAPIDEIRSRIPVELIDRVWPDRTPNDWLDTELTPQRKKWNVVLIAADSLRHDIVGFGEKGRRNRDITPNISHLAGKSLTFDRAYTPYPTSNYAYSSMLTGLYPRWTPVYMAVHDHPNPLPDRFSLPERLADEGWQTWAVTAFNAFGISHPAFFLEVTTGFETFNPLGNKVSLRADQVTDSVLEVIGSRDPNRPFMLWAHYLDPHDPYTPHPEFDFGDGSQACYESEVAFMDHHVGRLIARLQEADLKDDTVIVFLADHGEAFGEHNTAYHNSNLHEEQIRVPFFLHVPGVGPREIDVTASLVDVTPTILGLLGLEDPLPRHGRDLLPVAFQRASAGNWVDFSYAERFRRDAVPDRRKQRSLIHGDLKLIRIVGDPTVEIYDLARDPRELVNIADPTDATHQRLIGFMEGLDRRLDSLFDMTGPEGVSPKEKADECIRRFRLNDPTERTLALGRMTEVLVGRHFEYSPEKAEAIGEDLLEALLQEAVSAWPHMADPRERGLALAVLAELPQDSLAPFMEQRLDSKEPLFRIGAAYWFAKKGDPRGRELLKQGLTLGDTAWRVKAAFALARVGDPAGVRWLLMALNCQDVHSIRRAIAGLDAIAHPHLLEILRERTSLVEEKWILADVADAMFDAAARRNTDVSSLLLLELAHLPTVETRIAARRELSERFSQSNLATVLSATEMQILGDKMLRNADYKNAIHQYENALETGGTILRDDALRIRLARVLHLRGQVNDALKILETMVDDPVTRGWERTRGRHLRDGIKAGSPITHLPGELEIKAEMGEEVTPMPPFCNSLWVAKVKLNWSGGPWPLDGETWSGALRVSWRWRDPATGEFWDPGLDRLVQNFLPATGIPPGGTIEMDVVGVTPSTISSYEPVLIVTTSGWASAKNQELLALPAVSMTRPGVTHKDRQP